jgi:hypothetical protein
MRSRLGDERPQFRPRAMLAALQDARVEYIVIGGLAAALAGATHVTFDLDITPDRRRDNLDRLAEALRALNAMLVDVPEEVASAFQLDGAALGNGSIWSFITDHGRLDIAFEPSGTSGYADLRRSARSLQLGDLNVRIAALADVIRSKEAADRPRDRAVLPDLRRTLELRADRPDAG